MIVAIEHGTNEVTEVFGPFTSFPKAVKYIHRRLLATGGIDEEAEREAQGIDRTRSRYTGVEYESVVESLGDLGWTFTEVAAVDEDDEEMSDFIPDSADFIYVEDDGTVNGPWTTRNEVLYQAIKRLATQPDTLEKFSIPARSILKDWNEITDEGARIEALVQVRSIDLIHQVDWIVTTPAVYLASNIEDPDDAGTGDNSYPQF